MNIHPSVTILSLGRESTYADMKAAMDSYCWMFKDLTATEKEKLKQYLLANSRPGKNNNLIISRSQPLRWALIWWEKDE